MAEQTMLSAQPRTTSSAFLRYSMLAGVVGPVLFVIVLLIEGATRPGYSAWRNFGSQLSLSDQGWEQIANFLMCGLLCLWFALGLRRVLVTGKGSVAAPVALAIFGMGLIVAGIFVTDPELGYPSSAGTAPHSFFHSSVHSLIHGFAGLIVFASLAVACFVMARRFAGDPRWRGWAAFSITTGVVLVLSFVASNVTSVLDERGVWPNAPTGLIQRIGVIVGWAWIALLAVWLLRSIRRGPAQPNPDSMSVLD